MCSHAGPREPAAAPGAVGWAPRTPEGRGTRGSAGHGWVRHQQAQGVGMLHNRRRGQRRGWYHRHRGWLGSAGATWGMTGQGEVQGESNSLCMRFHSTPAFAGGHRCPCASQLWLQSRLGGIVRESKHSGSHSCWEHKSGRYCPCPLRRQVSSVQGEGDKHGWRSTAASDLESADGSTDRGCLCFAANAASLRPGPFFSPLPCQPSSPGTPPPCGRDPSFPPFHASPPNLERRLLAAGTLLFPPSMPALLTWNAASSQPSCWDTVNSAGVWSVWKTHAKMRGVASSTLADEQLLPRVTWRMLQAHMNTFIHMYTFIHMHMFIHMCTFIYKSLKRRDRCWVGNQWQSPAGRVQIFGWGAGRRCRPG